MDASYISLLLFAVALALLCAEFFIPSGGMILVMAISCCAGSAWFAWKAWWVSAPAIWWSYVASVVFLIPAVICSTLYFLPRTSVGRRVLLAAPTLDEVTPYADDEARLSQLVGKIGKTLTLLTPGGLVRVDGERMHCESEGMMIDPEQDVEVVAVKSNRLVVRLAREREAPAETADDRSTAEADPDDRSRLDFDVPQS